MKANHESHGIDVRRWLAGAALVLCAVTAQAAQVSRSEFNAFMDLATGAGKHTVGMGNGGVPVVTRGVPGPTQVGNFNMGHSNGGWPKASGQFDLNMPDGRKGTFNGSQAFTKASTGAALARFAAKIVFPVSTAYALYELLQELGLGARMQEDGEGWDYFRLLNDCDGAGSCLGYWVNNPGGWNVSPRPWASNKQAACDLSMAEYNSHSNYPYRIFSATPVANPANPQHGGCEFGMRHHPSGAFYQTTYRAFEVVVLPGEPIEEMLTEQELADLIAARSGWPSSSAVSRALADAMNHPKQDQKLETEGPAELTGPSSVPGASSTSTGSSGTVTISNTWNIGISGDTITVTSSTVTNTTNPDGTTATQTVTAEPEKQEGCESGAKTVGCAELDTPTGEDIPRSTRELTWVQENLGLGGGACPAPYGWTDSLGSHSIDLAPWCSVLSNIIKPLVLLMAALAAIFIIIPRET